MVNLFKVLIYFSVIFSLSIFLVNVFVALLSVFMRGVSLLLGARTYPSDGTYPGFVLNDIVAQMIGAILFLVALWALLAFLMKLAGFAGTGLISRTGDMARRSYHKAARVVKKTANKEYRESMGGFMHGLSRMNPNQMRAMGRFAGIVGGRGNLLSKSLLGAADGKRALQGIKRASESGKIQREKDKDARALADAESDVKLDNFKRKLHGTTGDLDQDKKLSDWGVNINQFNDMDDETKGNLLGVIDNDNLSDMDKHNQVKDIMRAKYGLAADGSEDSKLHKRMRAANAYGVKLDDHIKHMEDYNALKPEESTINEDEGETFESNGDDKALDVAGRYRQTHTVIHMSREQAEMAGFTTMNAALDINRTNEEIRGSSLNGSVIDGEVVSESSGPVSEIDLAADAENMPIHKEVANSDTKNMSRVLDAATTHQIGMKSDGEDFEDNPNIIRDEDGVADPIQDKNEISRSGEVLANGHATNGVVIPTTIQTLDDLTDEKIETATAKEVEQYKNGMVDSSVANSLDAAMGQGVFTADQVQSSMSDGMGGARFTEQSMSQNEFEASREQAEMSAAMQAEKAYAARDMKESITIEETVSEFEAAPGRFGSGGSAATPAAQQGGQTVVNNYNEHYHGNSKGDGNSPASHNTVVPPAMNIGGSRSSGDTFNYNSDSRSFTENRHSTSNSEHRSSTVNNYAGGGSSSHSSKSSTSSSSGSNSIDQSVLDAAMKNMNARAVEEEEARMRESNRMKNKGNTGKIRRDQ